MYTPLIIYLSLESKEGLSFDTIWWNFSNVFGGNYCFHLIRIVGKTVVEVSKNSDLRDHIRLRGF